MVVLCAVAILATACGGGSNGTNGTNGANALMATAVEAAGGNCTIGGAKIESGVDTNGNGVLDPSEIKSTQYVCNGSAGATGLATLVATATEPAGANCAAGGKAVKVGVDTNGNGVLDAGEVTATGYVCNGVAGSAGANGLNTLVNTAPEAAGANCANGGTKVTSGLDANGNGVLDAGEVTSTSYVCTGAAGAAGLVSLVSQTALAVGNANCANGGVQVSSGVDTNGNSVLDAGEVTSTQYICNGATGATGASGATGAAGHNSLMTLTALSVGNANCPTGGMQAQSGVDANGNDILDAGEVTSTAYACNGATGATGASGHDSLMSMVSEPAGANCTYGGTKVSSGVDTNGNGVLDAGEVTATGYVCNGAPGPVVSWTDVTASSVQAVSNHGYLADSASLVTVTLPASPSIGDVVSVTGVNSGGWKIAQNAGQVIQTTGLPGSSAAGPFVATGAPQENWWSVASSADGSKVIGTLHGGTNGFGTSVWQSTDSGASWNQLGGSPGGFVRGHLASSADGTHLVDAEQTGFIFVSADSGATWTQVASSQNWSAVASSSDGVHLVASVAGGQLYVSGDSGTTWTATATSQAWTGVAASADGTHMAATVNGGQIYLSTDSGVTWTAAATSQAWVGIASSSDGSHLAATVNGGQIWVSTDSGSTWTAVASSQSWGAIASSPDGKRLAAVAAYGQGNGPVWTSTDGGATWTQSTVNSQAVAATSKYFYTGQYNGLIYKSTANMTTSGTAGSLAGGQDDAIELQYVGGGTFIVLTYTSNTGSFTIH